MITKMLTSDGGVKLVRTAYFFDVKCNTCRINMQRGNRLEASVQLVNHMYDRHNKEDWKNLLDANIIQMYWNSPEAGRSLLEVAEIMAFMGVLAQDQDIPYEYWQKLNTKVERNGV